MYVEQCASIRIAVAVVSDVFLEESMMQDGPKFRSCHLNCKLDVHRDVYHPEAT